MSEPAIVALTPRGGELGHRMAKALGKGEVFERGEGSLRPTLQEFFEARRPIICIMAVGIAVRILGPMAKDKQTDPPVVVVDEMGQFAISLLGGHEAGANVLARQVAEAIGATPVITTASDVLGLPALDLIGRDWGWKIEDRKDLTKLMAAIVRGETIAVYQDAYPNDWRHVFAPWPKTFEHIDEPPEGHWAGVILVGDRCLPPIPYPLVIYRPPSLVLGVGCKRGVPCSEIESMFQYLCKTRGFSPLSLGLVATLSLKANEPGLIEFAANHDVQLKCFTHEELASLGDPPTPSERVRSKIGIAGVAEPAAELAAGPSSLLLMPKYKGASITMAIARRVGMGKI